MARHQDRTWYVLPHAIPMIWTIAGHELHIRVIAFAFDGDQLIYVTVLGTVIDASELATA